MTHEVTKKKNPHVENPILLSNLDPLTGCIEWGGHINQCGYGRITIGGKRSTVHRLAWELEFGPIPDGKQLDHICHNRKCINTKHLRLCTPLENARNRQPNKKYDGSRLKGASRRNDRNKWVSRIRINGKAILIGYFDTELEAHIAYCLMAEKHFGEFACGGTNG